MTGRVSASLAGESAVAEDIYRTRDLAVSVLQNLDIHQRHNAAAIGPLDLYAFIPVASTGGKGDGHGTLRGGDMRAGQIQQAVRTAKPLVGSPSRGSRPHITTAARL